MPRYTEAELRRVVATSDSYAEVLRHFGLRPVGGNGKLLRGWIDRWGISTEHFTHGGSRIAAAARQPIPLEEVLVRGSSYHRGALKRRLYDTGLKQRTCELCGIGEEWRGRKMALILDHVNGVPDDNRLENLRILCPNCNATLPTHCGSNRPSSRPKRSCERCAAEFVPSYGAQLFCSRRCASLVSQKSRRRVERPPYAQLLHEIETSSWSAVGRKYGVSCNAVRKWVQAYQTEAAEAGGGGARGGA